MCKRAKRKNNRLKTGHERVKVNENQKLGRVIKKAERKIMSR